MDEKRDSGFLQPWFHKKKRNLKRKEVVESWSARAVSVFVFLCICVFMFLYFCVLYLYFYKKRNLKREVVESRSAATEGCTCIFVFVHLCLCVVVFAFVFPEEKVFEEEGGGRKPVGRRRSRVSLSNLFHQPLLPTTTLLRLLEISPEYLHR